MLTFKITPNYGKPLDSEEQSDWKALKELLSDHGYSFKLIAYTDGSVLMDSPDPDHFPVDDSVKES